MEALYGDLVSGSALCLAPITQGAGVHDYGGDYAGAWHRRQYRHLHAGPWHPVTLAASGRSGKALPHR